MKSWGFAARDYAAGDRVDVAITIEDDPYSASRGYSPWCAALKEIRRSR
jgi:hypothetical protein